MAKMAFDRNLIGQWTAAMLRRRPPAPSTLEEVDAMPQVESFGAAALNVGLAVRFALRGGREQELLLNPVAARHLADAIVSMGKEAGWLDERLDVTIPSALDS